MTFSTLLRQLQREHFPDGVQAFARALDIHITRLYRAMKKGGDPFDVRGCCRIAKVTGADLFLVLRAAGKGDIADDLVVLLKAPGLRTDSPARRRLYEVCAQLDEEQIRYVTGTIEILLRPPRAPIVAPVAKKSVHRCLKRQMHKRQELSYKGTLARICSGQKSRGEVESMSDGGDGDDRREALLRASFFRLVREVSLRLADVDGARATQPLSLHEARAQHRDLDALQEHDPAAARVHGWSLRMAVVDLPQSTRRRRRRVS